MKELAIVKIGVDFGDRIHYITKRTNDSSVPATWSAFIDRPPYLSANVGELSD